LENDSKIIVILDGIDHFSDPETGEEESADWLPWTFPNHIQVIILCRKRAKALNHFKLRRCPLLYVDVLGDEEIDKIVEDYVSEDFRGQLDRDRMNAMNMWLKNETKRVLEE